MSQMIAEPSGAELALRHASHPALRRLRLEETDTVVVMTGTVNSYYLKQLAQEAIMASLEGRKLLNRVEVVRDEVNKRL